MFPGYAMKGDVLLLVRFFYGVMVFTCHAFIITPGSCLENNKELPGGEGKPLLSEKLDEKDHSVSSFSNGGGTEPVSDHADTIENSLVRTDKESILKGKDLYEKLCRKCHDPDSTETTTGPGMRGILKNKSLPSSNKPATARNILNQLNNPLDQMPSFHFLSEEDTLSIIAFLNTL